ncbi:pentapeptide repeat-containing protein [Sphaerisporangium sp. TRM90804]|uniref:pentapeptide repeat-containing protein n=1 Tax=Sphaerisporangium sp. TRM90804 TaxID=3031113 RepID=UPI0024485DBC|nr:pentapeptide repeat-containing protein [Sphaerisporangium sp. TRM90804]MDH2427004.1 pentapeptide repeat-containing protein [Sphaerisporangium sp. TRM90804]
MTSRQARRRRILVWSAGVVVVTVAAVAPYLLAGASDPGWWRPVLEWLPPHLVPPYSTADLPALVLTMLAAVALLVGAGCRFAGRRRRSPGERPLGPEEIEDGPPEEPFVALAAERGMRLQRVSTWGLVLGLLLLTGSLVYDDARSVETSRDERSVDYGQAVERLGSGRIEVRLDAIHTLRRLARDSERDRVATVDVMAAYVREHASMAEAGPPGQPATDVQMALTVLGSVYDAPTTELGHAWVCGCDLPRIRVPGANLSGLNLGTAVLTRANLRGASLNGANLAYTDLSGADLHGAYLDSADLPHAVLFMADLSEADLSGADLRGVDLFKADLRAADLGSADLSGVDLFEADLRGADLRGVNLSGASLRGADLRTADLREAILRGVDLKGADLKGADLTGADLTGANPNAAETDDETRLPAGAPGT